MANSNKLPAHAENVNDPNFGVESPSYAEFGIYGLSGVSTLLLDIYTAERGFSLRKLRTAYNGPCIRVIRDSDNEVQDIGFISGILDTGAIETFCSGTRGRVVKWYDQAGSGLAFSAGSVSGDSFPGTSLDRSPFIYESGAVVVNEHGLPALRFLDDNSTYSARLDMTSFYTESAPYVAYASVYSILDSGIGVYNTSPIISASNIERGLTVFHDGDQAEKQPKAVAYRSGGTVQTSTSTEVPRNTTTARFDYADRSFVKIFLNKEESAAASQTDRDEDFNTLLTTTIGGRNASVIEGEILLSELIGFTVDQTSANLAIRTELYDFWTSGVTPSSLSPKYGETGISKVYFGSTQISKIMHGNTQIF